MGFLVLLAVGLLLAPPVVINEPALHIEPSYEIQAPDSAVQHAGPCVARGRGTSLHATESVRTQAEENWSAEPAPMGPGAAIDIPVPVTAPVIPYIAVNKSVDPKEMYARGSPYSPASATVTLTVAGAGDPIVGEETTAPADIVFVVDNTGSMGGEIDDVKNEIPYIVAEIQARITDVQFGLATYRDEPGFTADVLNGCGYTGIYGGTGDYAFAEEIDLTTDTGAFEDQVGEMEANGGADVPEAVVTAVWNTVENFGWRGGDVVKVAILMGDYQGHDCDNSYGPFGDFPSTGPDPNGFTLVSAASHSAAEGIHWGTIGINDEYGSEDQTDDPGSVGWAQWHYLAEQTGGAYRTLNASGIASAIIDIVSTIVPTIYTAGEDAELIEVVPSYIVPSDFDPPYTTFDGGRVYTWDLGTIGINETVAITFDVESTLEGLGLAVDVYPETRVEYLAWDGKAFAAEASVPFPETLIDVVGLLVADAGGPYEATENTPVLLDGCGSHGTGGSPLEYRWDFDNDGAFDTPYSSLTTASYVFGDDGVFTVVMEVRENASGALKTDTATVTVHNVPPTIDTDFRLSIIANVTLRVAGEKWHDVRLSLFEDGGLKAVASVTRHPGSPDEQSSTIPAVEMYVLGPSASAVVEYTPMDDPENGQPWGANPVWIDLTLENGSVVRIHHTFNVQHPGTYVWQIPDFLPYVGLVGLPLHFKASASDVGSDDLLFLWDSGNGNTSTETFYNNGVSPDPHPSPEVNPITATSEARLVYSLAGTYTLSLTVADDDGGSTTHTLDVTVK